jgi:hypothetical protein
VQTAHAGFAISDAGKADSVPAHNRIFFIFPPFPNILSGRQRSAPRPIAF